MEIKHYLCPRACGKTSFAYELQKEDPENTLLIDSKTITSFNSLSEKLQGLSYKKVIFDEFLSCVYNDKSYNKDSFYSILKFLGVEELTLISTPVKSYKKEIFYLTCLINYPQYLISYSFFDENFINNLKEQIREINDYFLNPSKVEIIQTDLSDSKRKEFLEKNKRFLKEEQYNTEILGDITI